ncbi:IclR family transcriptional regulator [Ensifer soli]|uniref:IclR family transcriptional regulator n=1 Tax=Ciceribacter sp. sgz301302 TaxID=3342379 RepID=UPI0035B6DCF1
MTKDKARDESATDPRPVETGTIGRVLGLLELVACAETPLRFTDILARAGLPRGTLHRHLSHLVAEGMLELRDDLHYEPGLRLMRFAHRAWSRNDLRRVATPYLRELADRTGETVHLGVMQDDVIVYIDKVDGRQSVRMTSEIGKASPLYCTGIGKAALSLLPDATVAAIARGLDYRRFTPNTCPDAAALMAEVAAARRDGLAHDRQEHEAGILCLAAPVRTATHCAAISVTAPAYRVSAGDLDLWGPLVREVAARIGAAAAVLLSPVRSG